MPSSQTAEQGFTLIELSIVLVNIGLIVGGVLVGQDLVRAAGIRATITQVEKFNTAANTFFSKYGYLPGDIPAGPAAQFGFAARGTSPGLGDGNGLLQGNYTSGSNGADGATQAQGETAMFWVDLSQSQLIEGSFTAGSNSAPGFTVLSGSSLETWYPPAKVGQGNYFSVVSPNSSSAPNGISYARNYFMLSKVTIIMGSGAGYSASTPGLTVKQAYDLDRKIDDGLPQSGNVTAWYLLGGAGFNWAAGGGTNGTYGTGATTGNATTCYDNGGSTGGIQQYSVEISNGNNINCALTIKMQAGD